jgi:MmoB/DmpM family protein
MTTTQGQDVASALDEVGPVLEAGETAQAIIGAIRKLNANVTIVDRGSYLRVLVPGRCVVARKVVEQALGKSFLLPGDLELVMPSFKGTLTMTDDEAIWAWRSEP